MKEDLIGKMTTLSGIHAVGAVLDLDSKNIKDLAFQLKAEKAPFFGVFGSEAGGKVTLSIAISDDVVESHGLHAGTVRELASHIGGGVAVKRSSRPRAAKTPPAASGRGCGACQASG